MLAICQPNVSVLLLADTGLQDNSLAHVYRLLHLICAAPLLSYTSKTSLELLRHCDYGGGNINHTVLSGTSSNVRWDEAMSSAMAAVFGPSRPPARWVRASSRFTCVTSESFRQKCTESASLFTNLYIKHIKRDLFYVLKVLMCLSQLEVQQFWLIFSFFIV